MKKLIALLFIGLAASLHADEQTNAPAVETIICIRHGEKPKGGLGQLNCRGLNRALALPKVLLGKFGKPDFIFAPNPTQKADVKDGVPSVYYYIRPLMTIEPTAIRCGLPVNTEFGFKQIDALERDLSEEFYQRATIFVAWEHSYLDIFAKNMVRDCGGDPKQVPYWPGPDFDTIFVLKITRVGEKRSITFTIDHENLNNLSDDCPD